ncbi:MAG: uracil-DNA glycosylase [Planctomycetota bacterium]
MTVPHPQRVLRQHLDTDRLLGVDAVPLSASVPAAPDAPAPAPPPGRDKRETLATLDQFQVQSCTRCDLYRHRTQTVFGEGNPDAELMIVGEGPGAQEDRLGRPFVGPAGELLDKQIVAMGLTRSHVYIANVVKCRPPNNRTPTAVEARTCGSYLQQQIAAVRPRVILAVGGPAAKFLLDTDTGITRLRGSWHRYDNLDPPIPVMPTFHPAYLLRAYTAENRRLVWEDLQQVMRKLNHFADSP